MHCQERLSPCGPPPGRWHFCWWHGLSRRGASGWIDVEPDRPIHLAVERHNEIVHTRPLKDEREFHGELCPLSVTLAHLWLSLRRSDGCPQRPPLATYRYMRYLDSMLTTLDQLFPVARNRYGECEHMCYRFGKRLWRN